MYPLVLPYWAVASHWDHARMAHGLDELKNVQAMEAQPVVEVVFEFLIGAPVEERHCRADWGAIGID